MVSLKPQARFSSKNAKCADVVPAELPGYAPGAAYRMVETMLGRVSNLGQTGDFTTQKGDYTGTSPIYKRMPEAPSVKFGQRAAEFSS